MQRIIEEILKTEEDCAKRLAVARKSLEKRRAEIDAENSERVRNFREQAEAESMRQVKEQLERARRDSEEEVRRARAAADGDFAANQAVLDRIVDRIVDLVTGIDRAR